MKAILIFWLDKPPKRKSFSQLACSVNFSRQIRQNLQCSIVQIIDQPGQSDKKIGKAGIPNMITYFWYKFVFSKMIAIRSLKVSQPITSMIKSMVGIENSLKLAYRSTLPSKLGLRLKRAIFINIHYNFQ